MITTTGTDYTARKPPFQSSVAVDFIGMEKHASYFYRALVTQAPTGMESTAIN